MTGCCRSDPKVGGATRIAKVTAAGYRELTDAAIKKLEIRNKSLNKKLKTFFTK